MRLLPKNLKEVKKLKLLLKSAKNSTEAKRIMIMIVYLGDKHIGETRKILEVSSRTVESTIKKYIKDKKIFYKTSFIGRALSKEKEKLKNEIEKIISDSKTTEQNIDIQDVRRIINRKYKGEALTYHQAWSLIRNILESNYQKPYVKNYKQPKDAKKILKERFTEAIIKVGTQTNIIDGKDIKNKKTKNRANIV